MLFLRTGNYKILTELVWAKVMVWKYPVSIVVTDPTYFKAAGLLGAAAPAAF
jgi:hypothetical protein